jgi:flagellar hook-associated protein 3 FlgL
MQRVTNSILVSDLIRTLNERMRNLSDIQNQLSSGKRVNYASDDPAAAGLILELRNHLRQNSQYQENVQNGISWLSNTEQTLQELYDILNQARADAVEGSNEATTPEGMAQLAEEVDSFLENVFSISNSDYNGKTIFGGTNTTGPAFTATRDPVSGRITDVQMNPEGIEGAIFRQIGTNETMQINVSGSDVFMPEGAGAQEDLFQVLIGLRDALESGDVEAVGEMITEIDTVLGNVSDMVSLTGSRVSRLNTLTDSLFNQEITMTSDLSEQEDADLVELTTQLTLEQNAYQAALNVGSMIIQPSLVNFIS